MAIINVLDKNTIDKIAAGEVVERPASVVKELLENSVDAKAGAITIEIKNGGIGMIRITDDGCGMTTDDVRTAFMRHATSKIHSAKDLDDIATLGFRGEALSSIAAVSRVELITKNYEELTGVRYTIDGGEEGELQEIGAPEGTTFIVRNLFFNTPARKKFLKTDKTEGTHIANVVQKIALSHPEIAFTFISDGRKRFQTFGNGNIRDVIFQIYGGETARGLIEVKDENELYLLRGFIGKPYVARNNRASELFFVNGRFIRSNLLSKAVEDGYKLHLMQRQFPFVILYLDFSGGVDVNVHPQKLEVRFSQEREVYELLSAQIREAFLKDSLIPELAFSGNAPKTVRDPVREGNVSEGGGTRHENAHVSDDNGMRREDTHVSEPPSKEDEKVEPFEKKRLSEANKRYEQIELQVREYERARADFLRDKSPLAEIKIIGQIFETYWIIQYEDEMFVVDQHAAHEKVNFERLMRAYREKLLSTQMITPPVVLKLSTRECELLERNQDEFEGLGFEIEKFGEETYRISGVPADLYSVDVRELFYSILDDLCDYKQSADVDIVVDRIATASCKASVKGNQNLSVAEAKKLVEELMELQNPYQCPHGRPTMIRMTKTELEKRFKRIV